MPAEANPGAWFARQITRERLRSSRMPPEPEPIKQVLNRRRMPLAAAPRQHAAYLQFSCDGAQARRTAGADVRDPLSETVEAVPGPAGHLDRHGEGAVAVPFAGDASLTVASTPASASSEKTVGVFTKTGSGREPAPDFRNLSTAGFRMEGAGSRWWGGRKGSGRYWSPRRPGGAPPRSE